MGVGFDLENFDFFLFHALVLCVGVSDSISVGVIEASCHEFLQRSCGIGCAPQGLACVRLL